jgi:hypothetical protein
MADEDIKLQLDLADSTAKAKALDAALDEVGMAAEKAAGGADKLEQSTAKLGKSGGNSAQALLQLGRGVQDFSAAGILGITNNVEGLAQALGLGAGIAGTATLAVVGLQLLTPVLKKLSESFSDAGALAEAAAIKKLGEEAEKLKERLRELAGAHTARAQAMEKENQATERQIALAEQRRANAKKEADEETRRQKAAVAMEGAPGLDEQRRAPSMKGRAADIKKIVGGDPEAQRIRDAVAKSLGVPLRPDGTVDVEAMLRAENDRVQASDASAKEKANISAQTTNEIAASRAGAAPSARTRRLIQEQRPGMEAASKLLGDLYAGDPAALKKIIGIIGEGTLREQLEQLTPEAAAAQRMKDIGQTVRGFGRTAIEKTAAEAKRRRDARTDALNKQGAENEQAGKDQLAAAAEADRAKAAAAAAAKKADDAKREAAYNEARRKQQLANQVRQGTGLQLSPDQAGRLAGPDLKIDDAEMGQARAARQLQQEVFRATGVRLSGEQALDQVRQQLQHQGQALAQAQQEFIQAAIAAASGQRQQIQQLRQGAAMLRQRNQPMMNGGW